MSLDEVRRRAANLLAQGDAVDSEIQHSAEDALCRDLIRAIAAGTCPDPWSCCQAILPVIDLEYDRWYA